MWTSKRILLLLSGFVVFIAAYSLYALALGGIDGLPPLPEEFEPLPGPMAVEAPPPRKPETDRKLQMAFGQGWEELLRCTIKLEVRSRNLVLAADQFIILPDGRVQLSPFNIAIFRKGAAEEVFPEIHTVQSNVAYLTFDRPVTSIAEMGSRKIIAGELSGNVLIKNNRHTVQRDDDLSMSTPGPLYYREDQNLVWTPASVLLFDTQSKPEPTKITAVGMELHLTKEKPPTTAAAAPSPGPAKKSKAQGIGGVESVHLLSTVEMHLWVDANSGFLGSTKPAAPKGPAAPGKEVGAVTEEKPKLVITTEGPFFYEVSSDRAYFEIPKQNARIPEKVTVTRLSGTPGQEKRDQLLCDRLELKFHRKSEPSTASENRNMDNLTIENAHALGQQVTLISDAEGLHAIGNDFFYDAVIKQSILKGTPEMVAMKDGHEIYARELRMDNAGAKDAQKAKAKGPGRIALLDRATAKRTMNAQWRDELEFGKEGPYDYLELVGEAAFADQENNQKLSADRLKVWLKPAEDGTTVNAAETQKMRPHHLEATGHVTADSADLTVGRLSKDPTEHLIIWFKDVAPKTELPAAPAPAGAVNANTATLPPAAEPLPLGARPSPTTLPEPTKPVTAPPAAGSRTLTGGMLPGPSNGKAKKPIELSARSVETWVLRSGEKNDLEKLFCEGAVVVHQEPSDPEDKGVDIRGETLQLSHFPDGSILVVNGNLAQVQLNKITILGPVVNIDQRLNKAWVDGIGAMQMPTKSTLDGEQLSQPTEITIHWNKEMLFTGQQALFQGGVQAEQDNSRLVCQDMQVFLNRPVSFKEGEKGGQPAQVKNLVCDKSVRIEDSTRQGGRLTRYTRLTSPGVHLDKEEGIVTSSGPGVVHILQMGSADEVFPDPNPPKNAPAKTPVVKTANAKDGKAAKEELMLTRVNFTDRMFANNIKRIAYFYGNVEVVHMPSENPDVMIDVDRPPAGCMYLRCEQLKVLSHRNLSGVTTQEMEAMRKVIVQAQDFWGIADVVKYDESKELVIFEGGDGGMATMYQVLAQGGQPRKLAGKKIYYWRKSGEVKIEDGQGIRVQQ